MAANDEMSFEDAFNEDTPDKQMQSDDEAFGLNLPAGGDVGSPDIASGPAAVVIDIEPAGASASAGGSENGDNAQANADAANAEANEGASTDDRGGSTPAVKEAGAGGDGSAAEEATESKGAEAAEERDEAIGLAPPDADSAQASAGEGNDGSSTPDPYDMSDVPPEDMQQAKSWMGRLKKFEADLKAKAAALGQAPAATTADAIDAVADEPGATPEMAQAAEEKSDQVESGQMTPEQALAELAEDFGPDFIQKLQLAMSKMAGDAVSAKMSPLEQQTQDIIAHIQDGAEQAHFEQIFKAHPDFAQVAKDPAFQAFAEQQGKQDVVANGSAAAINQLITDFKASQGGGDTQVADAGAADAGGGAAPVEPVAQSGTSADAGAPGGANDAVDEGELDAAEGVRGNAGGLSLPKEPSANNDDFEKAWNSF